MLTLNTDNLLIIILSLAITIMAVSVMQQLRDLFLSRKVARQPVAIKEANTHCYGRGRPNEWR